ncbi:Beta-hexosaminidase [Operophtera brumata]|uniref:Beta-hexosaminidase n=1 Tax=Operophtera brumata TaxID=104452 RepID=A0A0L7LFG8_OPEBR|nr:Beta-hexosaminidase [Operophtera brumata]
MKSWGEAMSRSASVPFSRVGRMRRALVLLAAAACSAAALLYWRQQTDDAARHTMYSGIGPQLSWICRDQRCERLPASETSVLQSLQTCNMLCSSTQLWPQPTGPVSFATTAAPVKASSFKLQILATPSSDVTEHLSEAFALMLEELRVLESSSASWHTNLGAPRVVTVRVIVNGSGDPRMRLDTDESYKLQLKPEGSELVADISAYSFCGARHAFETLSQIVWFDPYAGSLLILEAAKVTDAPTFPFRGLLLDTSRNFYSVGDITRTIDAMASCKLNTFHWHVSDSQSFPLQLESVPQLAQYGAYGPGAVYTTDDIRAIVKHAKLRGIRVLLEVDAPAHVGRAWSWGPAAGLGDLAYCVEVEPWNAWCGEPPCGQLNPRNKHVYSLLEKVYAEIIQLTGVDDLFHLGGDEVSERCWLHHFNDSNPMDLWLDFTQNALRALVRANRGKAPELTLLWSSGLTRTPYLEKLDYRRLGVQLWGSSRWPESRAVLDHGIRAVLSHVDAWYLDCGFGSWRDSSDGHCGPYRSWQQMYEHRPWTEENSSSDVDSELNVAPPSWPWRIEGGAACQWSEQLDPGGLDARVWPRSAAVAERLWSDRAEGAEPDVYLRLDTHRARLVARGVKAAPLWPQWCSHNPHACL